MSETDFIAFAARIFRVPADGLSLATAYGEEPAWDSVTHLRLVQEIGDRYGVEIPFEKVPELLSLGALFDYIRENRGTENAK